jgi:hypothetical protein
MCDALITHVDSTEIVSKSDATTILVIFDFVAADDNILDAIGCSTRESTRRRNGRAPAERGALRTMVEATDRPITISTPRSAACAII